MSNAEEHDLDPEIYAISAIYKALKSLEPDAQERVLEYVGRKLKFPNYSAGSRQVERDPERVVEVNTTASTAEKVNESNAEDGINDVAAKWIRRSGLSTSTLGKIFSIGHDEIDLIAETVPGKNKKDRMHSVLLLKGIAAYLGSGAARVPFQQIKETSLHYDAYDGNNFAAYLKDFQAEVSGSKDAGYTLSPRGMAEATKLIKEILKSGS